MGKFQSAAIALALLTVLNLNLPGVTGIKAWIDDGGKKPKLVEIVRMEKPLESMGDLDDWDFGESSNVARWEQPSNNNNNKGWGQSSNNNNNQGWGQPETSNNNNKGWGQQNDKNKGGWGQQNNNNNNDGWGQDNSNNGWGEQDDNNGWGDETTSEKKEKFLQVLKSLFQIPKKIHKAIKKSELIWCLIPLFFILLPFIIVTMNVKQFVHGYWMPDHEHHHHHKRSMKSNWRPAAKMNATVEKRILKAVE